jgi:hypothetical protein
VPEQPAPITELIVSLKNTLDHLVEAITAYQKTDAAQRKEESETESKTVVRLPVEVTKYYESEERERPKASGRDKIRMILEIAGVIAAIILAILTFCTLRTLNGQLSEARRTNGDLERQFQAQQRPWIANGKIEVSGTEFLIYPGIPQEGAQVNISVSVPVRNVGGFPASDVQLSMVDDATEEIAVSEKIKTRMEYACGSAEKISYADGQVLFPNSPDTTMGWPMVLVTGFTDVTKIHRLWLSICVIYKGAPSDNKIHHTKIWMASWPIQGVSKETGISSNPAIIRYAPQFSGWAVVRTEAD